MAKQQQIGAILKEIGSASDSYTYRTRLELGDDMWAIRVRKTNKSKERKGGCARAGSWLLGWAALSKCRAGQRTARALAAGRLGRFGPSSVRWPETFLFFF
jgi:hypothetical protein